MKLVKIKLQSWIVTVMLFTIVACQKNNAAVGTGSRDLTGNYRGSWPFGTSTSKAGRQPSISMSGFASPVHPHMIHCAAVHTLLPFPDNSIP